MKAYFYTPEECGLKEFAPGLMRLAGFDKTTDPKEADVFVVPTDLYVIGKEKVLKLPYMKGNERKHTMLQVAERVRIQMGIPAMMFRCDCTKWIKSQDPTTIAWAWPVEDLGEWIDKPFKYDCVFQGWTSTPLTKEMNRSVQNVKSINSFIQEQDFFFGYEDENMPSTQELRRTFLETLSTSRLSLVARSIPDGVVRYRFYEAMSMSRVPVHACDDCVMPLSDRIDYDKCSITIKEADVPRTGEIVADWLSDHNDDDIRQMGAYGREMWDRWLNSSKWDSLFAEIVLERLPK